MLWKITTNLKTPLRSLPCRGRRERATGTPSDHWKHGLEKTATNPCGKRVLQENRAKLQGCGPKLQEIARIRMVRKDLALQSSPKKLPSQRGREVIGISGAFCLGLY